MDELRGPELTALEDKYASWDFRMGKALPFDATLETRFPWGGITLELSLKEGVIREVRVYSDAMDEALIEKIAPTLTGVRYESTALAQAVKTLDTLQMDELAAWLEGHEL